MKKKLTKNFWLSSFCLSVLFLFLLTLGIYYLFSQGKKVNFQEQNGGNVLFRYVDDFPGLKLTNPLGEESVLKNHQYFDFSIESSLDNDTSVQYEIAVLKDKSFSNIKDQDILISLEEEKSGTYENVFSPASYVPLDKKTELNSPSGSMILKKVKLTKAEIYHYRLKVFTRENFVSSGNYGIEVIINGK